MTPCLGRRIAGAALAATLAVPAAAGATMPGRNGLIAFHDGDVIYTVGSNGKGLKRVTDGFSPAWSHDGQNLAFGFYPPMADEESSSLDRGLMRSTASGENRTILTPGPSASGASWSPDSTRIAYTSFENERFGSYVMNADGSGQRLVVARTSGPAWSSKNRLAFAYEGGGTTGIGVMKPDGSSRKRLTRRNDYSPDWSPDSSRIAFVREFTRRRGKVLPGGLFVMRSNGRGVRRLFKDDHRTETTDVSNPSWSPDGRSIVFVRWITTRGGNLRSRLYVVRPNGTGLRRVMDRAAEDPAWQPLR